MKGFVLAKKVPTSSHNPDECTPFYTTSEIGVPILWSGQKQVGLDAPRLGRDKA